MPPTPTPSPTYGGQALIEGVLMRGRWLSAMAARRPDGGLEVKVDPNGAWAAPRLRRIPVIRGVMVLGESMAKGMAAMQWSANVSLGAEEEKLTSGQMALVVASSLGVALLVFFASPVLLMRLLEAWVPPLLLHLLEGLLRTGLLLGYLAWIGRMPEARRLFQYHGAEHKTIHAFEHQLPLTPQHIQPFSCAHPRCGTSFLLAVLVVSTLVFTLVGDLGLVERLLSRILLVPVVAGLAYEVLRLGAVYGDQPWARLIVVPGLWLQRFTTREPDDAQVDVAVTAFEALRSAEETTPPPPGITHHSEINA